MALTRNITADDRVYFDTDRRIEFTIYEGEPTIAEIEAGEATRQNVTGWTLAFQVRKKVNDATPTIDKATGGNGIAITGTYNADPTLNTQRVEVTIEDSDTYDPAASPAVDVAPGEYFYALKRTGAGTETMLVEGSFTLLKSAAWEPA